jgi:hypothetical protein
MEKMLVEYSNHWVYNYIESKYDPLTYDCWAHFIQVQEEVFGLTGLDQIVNISEFQNHDDAVEYIKTNPTIRNSWRQAITPKEGDAILFGYDNSATHIGTYVESNRHKGVLHCSKKHGVILTNMQAIRNCAGGFKIMRYNDFSKKV